MGKRPVFHYMGKRERLMLLRFGRVFGSLFFFAFRGFESGAGFRLAEEPRNAFAGAFVGRAFLQDLRRSAFFDAEFCRNVPDAEKLFGRFRDGFRRLLPETLRTCRAISASEVNVAHAVCGKFANKRFVNAAEAYNLCVLFFIDETIERGSKLATTYFDGIIATRRQTGVKQLRVRRIASLESAGGTDGCAGSAADAFGRVDNRLSVDERNAARGARLGAFQAFDVAIAPTIEIARQWWRDDGSKHCKNLFFRNHKGDRHYLVCFDSERSLAIRDLEARLRQGKLTFASPERMERWLGLRPGSVSPFGLINDPENHVHLFLDVNLRDCPAYSFHPNDNRATVVIPQEEFLKYLAAVGNSYEFIETY